MATPSSSKKSKTEEPSSVDDEDTVPEEIEEQCLNVHHSLASLESLLKPVLSTDRPSEEQLSDLDNTSLTLTLSYTINTLFWVYLTTQGIDPKSHRIKHELERIQKYMHRANVTSQRLKGDVPRVNKGAAERFVKNALWDEEGSSSNKRKRSNDTTL